MARGSSRSRTAHLFPTNVPGKFIEIKISYSEGGSRFTDLGYGASPRAFYMHVTPVNIEDRDGVKIKSFMMFHGRKSRLEEVKRFSEKKLEELTDRTRRECEAQDAALMTIVNVVLEEENLTLQETAAA